MTIEALTAYGANTEEGVARCMGMKDFYLRLVARLKDSDKEVTELEQALAAGDHDKAFQTAHALKGVLANLSITPVLEPMAKISDGLKAHETLDYAALMTEARARWDDLMTLIAQ